MTAHYPPGHFACETCGSPSITFPDEINDLAELHCANCGSRIGSWMDFKERTRQVILQEIHNGEVTVERASSDIPMEHLEN